MDQKCAQGYGKRQQGNTKARNGADWQHTRITHSWEIWNGELSVSVPLLLYSATLWILRLSPHKISILRFVGKELTTLPTGRTIYERTEFVSRTEVCIGILEDRKREAQKGVQDSIDRRILEETQGFAGPRALRGESEACPS
ncbi:uncharacterized protein BDR25DRAFT_357506 [Lindgomyces ingoldianus]|uniref:Uncharacterized protein n=1 Tax=Lindgomyces ingoldianus TaxID=673940 RepID=A0ACB6QNX0_9PLEO|nr:uncharacterized protein BDR25DRAFT_357506 [Lindgomyces ingoldianus]KAF2468572.1 hypothetical protein BDR25DRAFT_357506 [Lindgomyces ingoldianus]